MSKPAVASPTHANAAHLAALSNRHAELDARLSAEIHRSNPDELIIATLKKAKLKIKDAMSRL